MHSTLPRSRHRHRDDDDEELPLTISRLDERHSEPYTRSHNYSSRSDSRTNSSRVGYSDTPSRSHRSEEWRGVDSSYSSSNHERYRDDGYSHSRRDDYYERSEPRSAEPWSSRSVEEVHYSSLSREWTKRGDVGYTSTSYSESRGWAPPSRFEENSRSGYDDWSRTDVRKEREKGRYERDDGFSTELGWRTNDEGWLDESSRDRRSSTWTERSDEPGYWRSSNYDRDVDRGRDRQSYSDERDRQWEPAPSWKSRERDLEPYQRGDRSYNQLPPRSSKNKGKTKTKKGLPNDLKKDRRKEDTMNNWQKREIRPAGKEKEHTKSVTSKRKLGYARSPSPALSTYSRRSFARSRSRSLSPKGTRRWSENRKERREPSSRPKDDVEPSYTPKWAYSPSTPMPTRSGEDVRGRPRRPSSSSNSTRSLSRSSDSDTQDSQRRAKHRLPTATSMHEIELKAKSLSRPAGSQRNERNGKSGKASKKAERREAAHETVTEEVDPPRDQSHETMPPPPTPILIANHTTSPPRLASAIVTEVRPLRAQSTLKKNAGFKPIGQSSAAVKRFFPGDDDSDEDNAKPEPRSAPPVFSDSTPSTRTNGKSQWDRSNGRTTRERSPVHYSRESTFVPASHDRSATPAEDIPLSAASSRSKRDSNHRHQRSPPVDRRAHEVDPMDERSREQSEDTMEASPPETIPAGEMNEVYLIGNTVGEGTFGQVYKARNTITGRLLALKRIRMESERDGFPVTAMREVKLLQSLNHPNVVQLVEMVVHRGSVYIVFEYMDHDLTGILSQTQFVFSDGHLKSLCQQLLRGLSYLHHKGVIHRDIKGSNILINNRGELKLADFGLARFYQKRRRSDYTNRVITLWYRPPELLLGTTVYGPEVDMWSAGCIMLELFCKKPVFQGNDEIHQLHVIYKIFGTPTTEEWPGLVDMPWYELVKPKDTIRNRFRELFNKWLTPEGLDLAERLLAYDPLRRVSAEHALQAPYFLQEDPPPCKPESLATLRGEWHEYESKLERARKRRKVEGASAPGSCGPAQ